jgi:hypothetical protein
VLKIISCCNFPCLLRLYIVCYIGVGHLPLSFYRGELKIRLSTIINYRLKGLIVNLIIILEEKVLKIDAFCNLG